MKNFSLRTGFDRRSNPLAVAVKSRESQGLSLLDLTRTNPTDAGLPYERDAILSSLADARCLDYTPEAFGARAAREALAPRLSYAPPIEQTFLTSSTSEAYGVVFKLLCDPGDAVLVPRPSYPLFDHLATLEGVRLVPYRLAYDGAWHVDLDSLRKGARSAKGVIVVSPNNPTGTFLKKDELAAIESLGLPLISDEVFAEYGFGEAPSRVETAREGDGVLTFTMGGLSKSAALPQMKLAWTCVTGPGSEVREACERLEIVLDAYLSPSAPVQIALPRLLEAGDRTRAALRARILRNRQHIADVLAARALPATLLSAEGGWTACLRLPKTQSEDEWVLELLGRGVLVQPGAFYDFEDEPVIILSLLTPERDLETGFGVVCDALTR